MVSEEEFEAYVRELRRKYSSTHDNASPLLFRGQGDAAWPLRTTLERAGHEKMSFTAYYQAISRLSTEIETITNTSWELPHYPDIDRLLRDYDGLTVPLPTPVYRYMLYLRHHGFPSPLLDWSRSPHVAAYFAFRHSAKSTKKVSIYAFSEMPEGYKSGSNERPRIIRFGPYVRSHRRHFLQQSDYSICVFFNKLWHFTPHEDVFDLAEPNQDVLIKINIPVTERLKVLKLLDDHNLNAFSLFGSEESLMETMAVRALEFPKDDSHHVAGSSGE